MAKARLSCLANPVAVKGKTIAEALPAIRKKPDDFRFGLSALGAANHLAVLEFNKLAELNLQIIPYRGSAPALTDLLGGQVQLMIDPIITAMPLVQGGQLGRWQSQARSAVRRCPTCRPRRKAACPVSNSRRGTASGDPKSLPKEIVARINAALTEACASPPSSKN